MEKLKSHQSFSGQTEFWKHSSKQTGTDMKFSIYRPSCAVEEIKGGLIWLSGLTCTEENFITKAGAQRILNELNLALVCPDTSPRGLDLPGEHESYDFGSGAGFYLDAQVDGYKDHYRMESYIIEELYPLFDQMFQLGGHIGLFGHSMGGHGALTLGLKNPEKFKSISAFSPIVNPTGCAWGQKALKGYLGEDQSLWIQYDACELVKSGKRHAQKILIDQGLADEFYPAQLLTENFEKACKESDQKLEVNYRDNYDHSYYFISSFVEEHIRYHAEFM